MRRFLLAALFFALPLAAQTPPRLTWVRYYQVQPGKQIEFMRRLQAAVDPSKVIGWGIAVPFTHTDEPWTHLLFAALPSWASAEGWVDAIDRLAGDDLLVPGSTHDTVLRHIVQSETPPAVKPKFIVADLHLIKPGRELEAIGLYNEWAKPVLVDLGAKGKVGPWGLSMQDPMLEDKWTHMSWWFVPSLATIDDVDAALAALGPKLRGFEVRMRDMSQERPYERQILRIIAP